MILIGQFSIVGLAKGDSTPPNVTLRRVEPSKRTIAIGDRFNVKLSFIVKDSNNRNIYI